MQNTAFLFDNDGVLIDSSELHWESWKLLMQEDPSFKMDRKRFINGFGKRNDLILKELFPEVDEGKREKWATRKEELFRKFAKGRVSLLPGIENFLKQVKQAQIPRIIASSTPMKNLQMYIADTVLGDYFDEYLSAEQVAHGKPFPDVFLAAAKKLGFEPKKCVVFEDAPSGIQAAKSAGCFVVALATTHKPEELFDYDLLFSSPMELNLEEVLKACKINF